MQQEIEVKFLNVDFAKLKLKLEQVGAKLTHPSRLMRRVVMDYPDRRLQTKEDAWIRVRDEGHKVTLTFKQTTEHEFGGASEIETEVGDYQKTIDIFKKVGLVIHTDQETKRETWIMGEVEIVLDIWPWLNPYIEIEGPGQEAVKSVAKLLGFDWKDAVFGSVTVAYRKQYPAITSGEHLSVIPSIKFSEPRPDWFVKHKGDKSEDN